ncbi:hypothetical protein ACIP01_22040 [Pseudomonas monteilii]|uniref:hypothetical protein n=1 Tax=Pseudomonas monteilii TaxID=76759 RepID=UPI00380FF1C3
MKLLKQFFAGIANFFASRPDESVEPLLPTIDEAALRERFDIVAKAHEHGTGRVPAPDAVQPSPIELNILAELGNMRSMGFKYGEHRKVLIQRSLDKVQLTQDANRMAQLGDEFVRETDKLLSTHATKLKVTNQQLVARKGLLDDFRAKNKLPETDAALPNRNARSRRWAILIIAVAVEGVLNAFWFADGLADGLMGGFMLALGFSLTNVAYCFFAGRELTNINHVEPIRRVRGWLAGATGLVVTSAIGMTVAYYRYSLGVIEDDEATPLSMLTEAWASGVNPFIDFQSIMLLLVTIVFGGVAVWHAFHWTDTYPGYAKVFKAYKDAFVANARALAELRKKLDDEKLRKLELLEKDMKNAEERVLRYKSYMNDKTVVEKLLVAYTVKVENTLRSLIQCYRFENQLKRPADCPRPAYFDKPVELEDDKMPCFSIVEDQLRLDEQQKLLDEMTAVFQPTRKKIQSAFNSHFDHIQPLESHA